MKHNEIILRNQAHPRLTATATTSAGSGSSQLYLDTGHGYLSFGPGNSTYSHFETDRSRFYFNRRLIVNEGIVSSYDEDLILQRENNGSHQITISTSQVTSTLGITAPDATLGNTSTVAGALRLYDTGNNSLLFSGTGSNAFQMDMQGTGSIGTLTMTDFDIHMSTGNLTRGQHHTGHFEGSYDNIGANGSKTNPIYTIGSSYNPNESSLNNMYGVGFCRADQASFVSLTGASKWGMYVAAAGTARVYLDGQEGTISSTGQHYVGSNVVWNAGNDGTGSGLDADTVDSIQGASLLRSDATDTATGYLTFQHNDGIRVATNGSNPDNTTGTYYQGITVDGGNMRLNIDVSSTTNGGSYIQTRHKSSTYPSAYYSLKLNPLGGTVSANGHAIWHAGNDGTGSGLDADTVDSIQGASLLRSDVADSVTGTLTFQTNIRRSAHNVGHLEGGHINVGSTAAKTSPIYTIGSSYNPGDAALSNMYGIGFGHNGNGSFLTSVSALTQGSSGWGMYVASDGDARIFLNGEDGTVLSTGQHYANSQLVWNAGNDGAGSGLDADMLDGYQKSDINPAHSHYRWTGIAASGTQARRFVIMRLYGCPGHWDGNWQDIHLKVWSEGYEAANLKYEICGDYNGGNQNTMFQLRLKDAGGSSEHGRFRLVLGTPVDAGWDHSGQNTYYVDVYAEASHYMNFTVAADFYSAGFNVNTLPTSGSAISVVYSSPAVSNITTFTEAKEHSYFANHKIWNDGNHGSASGLDADLLDGQHGSYYRAYANLTGTPTIPTIPSNNVVEGGTSYSGEYPMMARTSANTIYSHNGIKFNGAQDKLTVAGSVVINGGTSWHSGNDGPNSGLDADTLDGKHHENFGATLATYGTTAGASGRIRCTAPFNTNSGHMFQITVSVYSSYTCHSYVVSGYLYPTSNQWYVPKCVYTGTGTPDIVVGRDSSGKAYISIANDSYTGVRVHNMTRGYYTSLADTYDPWTITIDAGTENSVTPTVSKVWHSTNDGTGSGLDADSVDGVHEDTFMRKSANSDLNMNFNKILAANGTAAAPSYSFNSDQDSGIFRIGSNAVGFSSGGTERFKINSNGLLLTGSSALYINGQETITASRDLTNIVNITNTDGYIEMQRTGAAPAIFDRLGTTGSSGTSNGEILNFKTAGTKRANIGFNVPYGNRFHIGFNSGSFGIQFYNFSSGYYLAPSQHDGSHKDNLVDLGTSGSRWDDVYATNGTIQTSDRNEKQDIQALTDAETRVATACKGLIRRFRWVDSVQRKGDDARYHFGAIAQDVEDAFTAEGLNAGDYALFIKNHWWEHEGTSYPTAEEAPTGAVEKVRRGIRYNQLLAFIISAL